jgi:hypothetical protein
MKIILLNLLRRAHLVTLGTLEAERASHEQTQGEKRIIAQKLEDFGKDVRRLTRVAAELSSAEMNERAMCGGRLSRERIDELLRESGMLYDRLFEKPGSF